MVVYQTLHQFGGRIYVLFVKVVRHLIDLCLIASGSLGVAKRCGFGMIYG